jgi:large conductance mechanosensitive channel
MPAHGSTITRQPSSQEAIVMFKEFRDFIARGNVIDLAVGIIIGAAFGKIITSFVANVLMPPIGLLLGKVDFSGLFFDLSRQGYATLADAQAAGAPVIAYGMFINTIIDFIIVAFVIFLVIRQVNKMKPPLPATAVKECPYCLSSIPDKATKCASCTSELASP